MCIHNYDGYGIPQREAMSFDCQIACSREDSIPEVVGECGVYFEHYSEVTINQALEDILKD